MLKIEHTPIPMNKMGSPQSWGGTPYTHEPNLTTKHPTMSSREIATLCDKRHDNVMADIRKMLDELDIYAPDFSGTFITEQGNQYECLILVSGYNVKIRTKIIDRWQQLEVDVSKFGGIYLDSMNRQQTEYGKP